MKKIRSLFVLILAATLMTGCSGLNKMKKNSNLVKYDVTPKVLETHGGTVTITITGSFPDRYFNKKATLTATPVLKYAGGEIAFDKVQVVQGEKVQANNKVINYSGGNFTYTSTIPYTDDLKMSELFLNIRGEKGAKIVDFDPIKLADGVIATSTLVEKYGRPIILKDRFQRIIPETGVAAIPYIINRSDLQSSTLKAEDIANLRTYINDVNADPDRQFKTTVVSSYASPDGAISLNERLSTSRGKTAGNFIRKEFAKIEDANAASFFDEKTTAEDWDGFRTELEKSSLSDKDLILRVLSMYSDPDVREREIKNMSAAYESLKTDVLPKLRRSQMVVNVDKIGRSDEQILEAMRGNSSVLDVEEMLYSATLTNDLNEQLKFYQTAVSAFPRDIRTQNNVGCALLNLGQADNAIAAFERAKAIENNDVVKNNLGMGSLVRGGIVTAEEYFTSMTAATPESRWGLGVIAMTKGEYDKAVNSFGSEPSVNHALALMLKGDNSRAKTMLDGIQESFQGKRDYLKAVAGARLDDRTYMLNGLRGAISADSKWKAYAKTDLEFAKYFNDDTFKSTVQ